MVKHFPFAGRIALLLLLVGLLLPSLPASGRAAPDAAQQRIAQDIQRLASDNDSPALADIQKMGLAAAGPLADALLSGKDQASHLYIATDLQKLPAIGQADLKALAQAATTDADNGVRVNAAASFQNLCAKMGPDAVAEVPDLERMLTASHDEADGPVRGYAAQSLGSIGRDAQVAVPDLTRALGDSDPDVPTVAADALGNIGGDTLAHSHELSTANLAAAVSKLGAAAKVMDARSDIADEDKAGLHNALAAMNVQLRARESTLGYRATQWALGHKPLAGGALYVIVGLSLCLILLAVRPLWILRINDWLQPYTDIPLPAFLGGVKVPARTVLLVGFFHYHPRVLDAWVAAHITRARKEFARKDTVRDRRVCVPIPVVLDDATVASLSGSDLRPLFSQTRGCLLISGEGGAGKTTMACQVANWAMSADRAQRLCDHLMLPVLIEHEIDFKVAADKQPLKEAICGQLQFLIEEAETIQDELLERLLRQRRVLVIVDHFSEMSEATRQQIRPADPEFPVNAMIVTSRAQEELDGMPRSALKPLRIEGNRLSSFMEAYLTRRGKRELFEDTEYFEACRRLSQMVGQRKITVLLAKLYAEQMIAAKQGEGEGYLPDNIPDLMLSYLNEMNRGAAASDPDNRMVQSDAKLVAWECLKTTLRPAPARREDIVAALGDGAEVRLIYLERRLRLLQTIPPAEDQIRFALDPLAESLAGLHLVETFGKKDAAWRKFLAQAEAAPGGPESVKGFLLAVRDCCLARVHDIKVPGFVPERLTVLAGVTPPPAAPNAEAVAPAEPVLTVAPGPIPA